MPKTSPDEAERLLAGFFKKAGRISVRTEKRKRPPITIPEGVILKNRMTPEDTDAFPNLKKGRFK